MAALSDKDLSVLLSHSTPAPWRMTMDHGQEVHGPDGEYIARVVLSRHNAKLVCAAPDLAAEVLRLREALTALVDEYCDYARINSLGDPEKQHNIKRARAALSGARA